VKNITQDANGVEVSMDDGSVEKGDMVLGVDGVSSLTRTMMWKHADVVQPGLIPETDKTCIQTRWQALIGLGPHEPKLGPNAAHVVHDHKFSFLMITQSDRVFWFVFFRLEKTKVWPERGRYTKAEAEDIAKTIANHPLNEQMKFGELWEHRERGDLIPIEEGVLDVWHHDRIVLAGDAAHKV
jgi:2-polyprenyl-6-methoxyphenol hydroxylase-like FAD-dependent oxidoreductase